MEKTIKNCILIVNGGKVFVREEHPGEYLSCLFMSAMNLQYWSFEALKEFYYENVELVIEFCIIRRKELCGSRKAIFTRFITYGNDSLLQRTFKDRYAVLICVYNLVLKSEGLGFLRGFGISDHEGKQLMGNPEYSSIINIERGEENRKVILNEKVLNQKQIIFNKRKESKKMSNVKFGDLKKAIQALNEMDHIEENIRYVGVKKEALVELFLKGVEDCPEEDEGNLPEVVVEMNNFLIDDGEPPDGEKEEKEEVEETENKEECSDFGKGHGKDKDKCGECKEEYPEDYDKCKKLSKPKAKTTAKKKTGKTKAKKVEGKKKEKKQQEDRYTRFHAFYDAIKSSGTVAIIGKRSDDLYVKNNGKTNIKQATGRAELYLNLLCLMETVTKKGTGKEAVYFLSK